MSACPLFPDSRYPIYGFSGCKRTLRYILTITVGQGLMRVGFSPGARLIWQVRRPGRSHIARRLHTLGYRPLRRSQGRVIGSGGGSGGAIGSGPGVHTVYGSFLANRRLAVPRWRAGRKFCEKKTMSALGSGRVHWDASGRIEY